MKNDTRVCLSQIGLDARTIDAISMLADFIDNNQYVLEHKEDSVQVNSKIRNDISVSQEFKLIRKILTKISEKLELDIPELDQYNKIVEEAKK